MLIVVRLPAPVGEVLTHSTRFAQHGTMPAVPCGNDMSTKSLWIESSIGPPDHSSDDWLIQCYQFGGHTIRLVQPRNPDRLLDDPMVQRQSCANDYMPYWAYVWPGALLLAEHVLGQTWREGSRAIEIGCGLGLAGVAALMAGLQVVFTDYSPAALALASHNAHLNGFDRFETKYLDWQDPARESFDLVLGADVLYESRCLSDVLRVLDRMLGPKGIALLSDPGRATADPFPELARQHTYAVLSEPTTALSPSGKRQTGRIFRVNRATHHSTG